MALVSVYAHREDRAAVLEQLQRWGVMDLETVALSEETAACPEGFSREETEAQTAGYERNAAEIDQALGVLNEYAPQKKGLLASFSGRREISQEAFSAAQDDAPEQLKTAYRIVELHRKIAETRAEIVRLKTGVAQLALWEALDVPLSFSGTTSTAAFIGTVVGAQTEESLLCALAERAPEVDVSAEILGAAGEQTAVFLLCARAQADALAEALRTLGFARPAQLTTKIPRDKIADRTARIEAHEKEIEAAADEIVSLADRREALELTADYFLARAEQNRTVGLLDQTEHAFRLRGYLPEREVPLFRKRLEEAFAVSVESEPADEELAPVKLRNNAFCYPAETITEMYALPTAQDIDPTPITSFFYYFFFGMMLADAGYGLLLALGSWFLMHKCRPETAMRRNLKLFFYCGVSTTLWGLVFGSFFGDAVAVISEHFFGHRVALPALLDPMNGDAVQLLILSILLGFVQILVGLGTKFYILWKNGERLSAVFDVGFWITTLLGIALFVLGMTLLPPVKIVGAVLAIASAVGLVATQGRSAKGVMKLFSGLASLYDITGYVSDLLSFSRLMALGLTSAAMAAVFNLLGTMAGKGVVGLLVLLIIFPVGHAVNFGLNALGAYVHTLRLQYVELFSKFYEGGGRAFKPFAIPSKYVRIKEENQE